MEKWNLYNKYREKTGLEYDDHIIKTEPYRNVVIETKDLLLKKAKFEDWYDMYHNLWKHKDSAKYMLWNPTTSEEEAKERMERTIEFEKKEKYALLVYEKASDHAIGFAGMREEHPGVYVETGVALGPDYVGRGYGKQILNALTKEAFTNGKAHKFVAACRTKNIASHNLQMSCGFVFSHTMEKKDPRNDEDYTLEYNYKFDYANLIPTAEKILNEAVQWNPGPWEQHSKYVAEAAKKIAEHCDGLNPDRAYVCGLLHDIGRKFGVGHLAHVYDGYQYLMELGYPEIARTALSHSFNFGRIEDYIGNFDIAEEQQEELRKCLTEMSFDDYDYLIQLCDAIAKADGIVPLEERMNDVKSRYGNYPQEKWDRNMDLKKYFERKMGKDLYDVVM